MGVGGVFFRSKDPARLGDWYAEHLGFEMEAWGDTRGTSFSPLEMPAGSFTVWSAFDKGTEYFGGSGQSFMINNLFRISEKRFSLNANCQYIAIPVFNIPALNRY